MLLALTFSLFFIVFGILALTSELGTISAMAIAALLSFPLLILHVSRICDLKFALLWILPLALYSLIIVINGVYGESYTWNIYIGAIVSLCAFLTISWTRWRDQRQSRLNVAMSHSARNYAEAQGLLRDELTPGIEQLHEAEAKAKALLVNHRLPEHIRQTNEPLVALAAPVYDE